MKLHHARTILAASDPIAEILRETKTIAVIGLSANPLRASFAVSEYLQRAGYRIIPVNPNEKEVLGETCYARMEDIPERIDMVDVFRRAEYILPLAESAIKVGAKTLWLQLGIEHAAAARLAYRAGLNVVEDACLLIEHKKRRPLQTPPMTAPSP